MPSARSSAGPPKPPLPVLAHAVDGPPDGEAVVLLNGGMMTWRAWGSVTQRFRESDDGRYRVVGSDFRGQALTPGPPPATLAEHADDVLRLLDHLEIPAAHLVGTSFGAMVGVLLAGRHPGRVRSLVAATVTGRASAAMDAETRHTRRRVADVVAGGDRRGFHERLVEEVFSAGYRERESAAIAERRRQLEAVPLSWFRDLDGLLAAVEGFDLRPAAAAVRCPTLVILAAGDRVMPEAAARALAATIPAARVEVHPTAGHALVVEDPDWLAQRCLEHLERVGRPQAAD